MAAKSTKVAKYAKMVVKDTAHKSVSNENILDAETSPLTPGKASNVDEITLDHTKDDLMMAALPIDGPIEPILIGTSGEY